MARKQPIDPPPPDVPRQAIPAQVAKYLYTTEAALAQMRYMENGPKFIKVGDAGCSTTGMTSWNGLRETPSNEPTIRGGENNERSGHHVPGVGCLRRQGDRL
jgi:hypothetical protein